MAKFCTNCGAKLEGDFEFCTECGSNLNAPAKPNGVVIRNFVGENDNIKVSIPCTGSALFTNSGFIKMERGPRHYE